MNRKRLKAEKDHFRDKRRKTIFSMFLILAILASFIFYYFYNNEEVVVNYLVCDYSPEATINKFSDYTFDDKQVIKDYFFYGETLNLFEDTYNIGSINNLLGKTILLHNVCTNEEYYYLIDNNVDGQIPINLLSPGFYEIFVNVDMIKKRVVYNDKLFDHINTVRRNNKSNNIELVASENLFYTKANDFVLDDNYLFINVKTNEENIKDFDIVLDPGFGVNQNGYYDNYGASFLDMLEADELFDFASTIKKYLEAEGLKVLITRLDKEHIINLYGQEGRLEKAYDSNAKYYIELNFNQSELGGLKVYHSSYASRSFSSYLANYLLNNTSLNKFGNTSTISATRYSGLDGVMSIREIGGKALAAATYSEIAEAANSAFALNNRKGLEALSIEFLSYKNSSEIDYYINNKEEIAKELASGLIEYFALGIVDDISD